MPDRKASRKVRAIIIGAVVAGPVGGRVMAQPMGRGGNERATRLSRRAEASGVEQLNVGPPGSLGGHRSGNSVRSPVSRHGGLLACRKYAAPGRILLRAVHFGATAGTSSARCAKTWRRSASSDSE